MNETRVRPTTREVVGRFAMIAGATVVFSLPSALAFMSGGYFSVGRSLGLLAAFVAVLICAAFAPQPLPDALESRLTLGSLLALCAATGILAYNAPSIGPAFADFQRLLLYLAFLTAAIALLTVQRLRRFALTTLLTGITIVCIYSLLGRCLPELIQQMDSTAAQGRLEQPISYWNALGIFSGFGTILAAGLSGRPRTSPRLRALSAASLPWTAAALTLTLSRGAIAATVVGLLLIVVVNPTRQAATSVGIATAIVLTSGVAALSFPGLRSTVRDSAEMGTSGILLLATLVAMSLIAAAVYGAWKPASAPLRPLIGKLAVVGLIATLVALPVLIVTGQSDSGAPAGGRGEAAAGRLVSTQGSRLTYWETAIAGFVESPLTGEGPSSFRVRWLRERPFPESANDAHSLYVETAAELGLLGIASLFALLIGMTLGAIRARQRSPEESAPAIAVLGAFLIHAGLDWDWEVPSVTLAALTAAAFVVTARSVRELTS